MADYAYWGLPGKDAKDIDPNFVSQHKYQTFKWFRMDLGIANQHRKMGTPPKGESAAPAKDPFLYTHMLQEQFHRSRAMAFLELLKNLSTIPDAEAKPSPHKVPSLFDKFKDGAEHTPEEALRFHSQLMGECMVQAARARNLALTQGEMTADGWYSLGAGYDSLSDLHRTHLESFANLIDSPINDLIGPTDMKYLTLT